MKSELSSVLSQVDKFAKVKELATGLPLQSPDLGEWGDVSASEVDFKSIVSTVYICWRELWRSEITFLTSRLGSSVEITSFSSLIYDLRTSYYHSDNSECIGRAQAWMDAKCEGQPSSPHDWNLVAVALLSELVAVLGVVNSKALSAYRDERLRNEWATLDGLSADRIVLIVASDLGLNFNQGTMQFHVREVQKKIDKIRPGRGIDITRRAESLAEAHLTARFRPLPIHYRDLLEDLNLTGKPAAESCLRLAHAVAEITSLKGEDFLKLFRRMWQVLMAN
ncbi:hypothetical protein HC744_06055 [Arthrobacter sp. S1_S22]|nr:hypothetical protein [Arthrobacter sp. S1_S22]